MNEQQYLNAKKLFETYEQRVEDNSLTVQTAWADKCAAEVLARRQALLTESDWTQLPDVPVNKESWAVYRQALRDITDQENYPLDIVWPEPPV